MELQMSRLPGGRSRLGKDTLRELGFRKRLPCLFHGGGGGGPREGAGPCSHDPGDSGSGAASRKAPGPRSAGNIVPRFVGIAEL